MIKLSVLLRFLSFLSILMVLNFPSLVLAQTASSEQYDQQGDDANTEPLDANPDVESQVKGDYPEMMRKESLPLGAIQHAWDRPQEGDGVYTVQFNPREIIKVRLREYMTTTIALPAWERIKAYELGDEGTYKVKRINPTLLNVKTNGLIGTDTTLTVYGESGQIYAFYMRSEGYNSKNISDVIVHVQAPSSLIKEGLEFHQKVSSDTNSPEGDFLEAVSSDPGDLDFNYSMAGDAEIAPDRIYTDGKKTWFDYGSRIKKADLPAVFNVVDGIDTPVNVIREGGKLVAFGTGTFSLKHGKRVTCVYPTDSHKA